MNGFLLVRVQLNGFNPTHIIMIYGLYYTYRYHNIMYLCLIQKWIDSRRRENFNNKDHNIVREKLDSGSIYF